jgi:hypothetical protein
MLIFQVICLILISYQILRIIVRINAIIDLKRKALIHTLEDVDVNSAIISIRDKVQTSVFRIVVYSFMIIILKHLSLS